MTVKAGVLILLFLIASLGIGGALGHDSSTGGHHSHTPEMCY